jgi:nicotinate phosphoribosyltransferase
MFHIATPEDIKTGRVTDVYFVRTIEILQRRGIRTSALGEVLLKDFPHSWKWGVFAGLEEAASLLAGLPVDVDALDEGTIFHPHEPVLTIEGPYVDYAVHETALLGLLCQASGVATKAARCKKAAAPRPVVSFGARRMHPAIAPMVERNAFLGGCDGVAVVKSAELIKQDPVGTMPHALILVLGDTVEAARAFNEIIDKRVRRVVLIDTFGDEKFETLRVAEALGKDLFAVRLDTPGSRRGNMLQILREVRWELDLRGFQHVKLFVSGGLDEADLVQLRDVADSFGVGTCITNAPVVNFALDLVEIAGQAFAKRGKLSGRKVLYECPTCLARWVVPAAAPVPACGPCGGRPLISLLKPLIRGGKLVRDLPPVTDLRARVLERLERVEL